MRTCGSGRGCPGGLCEWSGAFRNLVEIKVTSLSFKLDDAVPPRRQCAPRGF